MRKSLFLLILASLTVFCAMLTSCEGNENEGEKTTTTAASVTTTASPTKTTTAPVTTTEAPATTTTVPVTTTTAPVTTTTAPATTTTAPEVVQTPKVTLDAEMDALYTEQGLHYPTTALYIYSSRKENRDQDKDGNALSCKSSGVLDFCFDGEYLWYYCTVYDTTMFDADTEYVLTDVNPWQTDSVEVWYSFDGKKLLHVDVDAWGLRLFTDENSTSVHFDEVIYRVKNDKENGVWYAEIGVPAKDEKGNALKSGDTVYIALQINDLMTDFKEDPSRTDNLAFNGGHKIGNFKKVVLP